VLALTLLSDLTLLKNCTKAAVFAELHDFVYTQTFMQEGRREISCVFSCNVVKHTEVEMY